MRKLSKYEKGTIINYNEGDREAIICTFDRELKKRLAVFSKKYPELCQRTNRTDEGRDTYVVDKNSLLILLIPPRVEAGNAVAQKYGFKVIKPDRKIA
jgi:hypothetical protein